MIGDGSGAEVIQTTEAPTGKDLSDLLERQPTDARDLYFEWERSQWEAGTVELARDREDWTRLSPALQNTALALLSCWLRDQVRVQELTVVLADGVVTEQDQVFMTTQLADSGRHSVAFQRFFDEVAPSREPRSAAVELLLARAEEAAGGESGVERALFLNNVVVEGVLAPVAQTRLVDLLAAAVGLEGLRTIVTASFRDHARHAAFASGFLRGRVDAEPGAAGALEAELKTAAGTLGDVVGEAAAASNDFEGIGIDRDELGSAFMDCFARRLQDIGLDLP